MPNIEVALGIVAVYFMVVLGVVMVDRFKTTRTVLPNLNELLLANKSLPSYVLVATYIASLFSTFSVLGIPTYVYAHGVGGYGFVIISYFIGLLACFSFYKYVRRFSAKHDIFSPLEALSISYGTKWIGLLCAVLFMIFITPYVALQLVAVGSFLEGLSGGQIGYLDGVGAMMFIIAIYLILGGMRAVAYTDFIQLICMFIGIVGGAWILFQAPEFNLTKVYEDKELMKLPGPKGTYDFWYLFSISVVIAGTYFQPHLLTRAMMAKNDRECELKGIGGFWAEIVLVIPVIFFGLGAIALFGSGIPPNEVIGRVFDFIANSGLFGLIIASLMLVAVLGAAMSTADSLLLSMGQMTTRDIAQPFLNMTRKKQVILSKSIMFLMLLLSYFIGINPPELMGELVVYAASGSMIMVPTIIGFLWPKRDYRAAFASIFIGFAVLALGIFGGLKILTLHEGFVSFAASAFTFISLSLYFSHKKLAKPA